LVDLGPLLVRKFNWPCPVKELRSAVGGHVLLELDVAKGTHDSSWASAAQVADVSHVFVGPVGENLAVEESEVVGTGPLKARVGVRV